MMTTSLKQRIVGAIFILSLGVILIPIILDKPEQGEEDVLAHVMPETPAPPDVSDLSKIHYVFNDPSAGSEQLEDTLAVVAPLDMSEPTSTPELVATATVALSEAKPEVAAPAKPVSAIHQKAKEGLAQAAAQAQWTIQLGAFSSEQNAQVLMERLSRQGFQPYLRKNDALVRVYVSPGVPREQAQALAAKLDTELGLKGIVVRYFQ